MVELLGWQTLPRRSMRFLAGLGRRKTQGNHWIASGFRAAEVVRCHRTTVVRRCVSGVMVWTVTGQWLVFSCHHNACYSYENETLKSIFTGPSANGIACYSPPRETSDRDLRRNN